MTATTYSLKVFGSSSDNYYQEISQFTNAVVERSQGAISALVKAYVNFCEQEKLDFNREYEEYLLDFLCFGVLWKSFSQKALSVGYAPLDTLAKMGHWRKQNKFFKPAIDYTRGVCFTMFLLPEDRAEAKYYPTKEYLPRFLKWLAATGEYNEQVLRLNAMWQFIESLNAEESAFLLEEVIDFADWFEYKSTEVLGKYTENVEKFLSDSDQRFRWREDRIQCSAPRLEYHFNMVGAELMNRAFRKEFNATTRTAILLPGCMRLHNNENCRGIQLEKGLICTGCHKDCRVNQLRKMGCQLNFEVYIIPHSSDLSQWQTDAGDEKLGVIASACVTSLVEGGLELRRYGVPAQCVLLDYSGCSKHWHPVGVTTELNQKEMFRILERD